MQEGSFLATLRAMHDASVEFIVVGGVAASLHGAPGQTLDIDVVHSRHPENIARILPVLEDLDAIYRIQPDRRLRPTASHLASPGHQNLITKYGPVDFLGMIGHGLTYQDLLPHSEQMWVAEGIQVRVIDLETLIQIKEELGGEKDKAMLPVLRRTLEEKKKKKK